MQKFLRHAAVAGSIALAALMATPAQAAPKDQPAQPDKFTPDACTAAWVTGGIACVGYYSKNPFNGDPGSATDAATKAAIEKLLAGPITGTDGGTSPAYSPPYTLDYDTILAANSQGDSSPRMFNILLSGLTIVGIHWGNTSDAGDNNSISAIWLVNLVTPTNGIALANPQGSSTVRIYATGGAGPVPEPGTWALMLLGFGSIGYALRRRRRANPALLQLA